MSTLNSSGPQTADAPTPDDAFHEATGLDARESQPPHGSGDGDGPVLAADGRPLKQSLKRALRAQKLRALMLIAPLLIFVLVTFIAPIADMLFRSVENQIVSDTLPRTTQALAGWDEDSGAMPPDNILAAFTYDMVAAAERKEHTRLGTRLNYEMTGISSLFRKTGRRVDDFGETYLDQFEALDPAWEEAKTWVRLMGDPDWLAANADWAAEADAAGRDFDKPAPPFELKPGIAAALPETADAYAEFARITQVEDEDNPAEEEPWAPVYLALFRDLAKQPAPDFAALAAPDRALLAPAAQAVPDFETVALADLYIKADEDWADPEVWKTIKAFSPDYTSGYFLASVDLQKTVDGVSAQPEDRQIYMLLFKRTLFMSMVIMGSCVLLGYPIAYLLSNLPMRTSNLLLILVLLPFWTSLLVRTSAWKVLLQQQGVINDILVWAHIVADDARLVMINNQFGTIVAMTHILLPFMILPLYSVMKTIPPSYVRAAKSLGATNWTAFWRVYFPQSVPGIGAGCILVFILAIGYYITPELVGGTTGTFISNRIAYHISSSLNWGLAAALGTILLAVVLILYWLYDRLVGIDNVSLG
ncbi:ABC transporter permease [Rhodovulum adriaticum]|uniref:Putative spermidine/putrescine transport system permease protein n=1 Tax=Rhodovulum adriaticum TaxID=35804 RepID=A0A4R2NWH7_RHOAD|nr:ABC transporter permease [Rhodovulum adriaticum]MBK1637188.1 polyamine ABC transporter permease [Rhodovulum adriaticum]TCP26430.1 putative spermidine/putrescine transport system permease protein [Rhodovulum adriaticum]